MYIHFFKLNSVSRILYSFPYGGPSVLDELQTPQDLNHSRSQNSQSAEAWGAGDAQASARREGGEQGRKLKCGNIRSRRPKSSRRPSQKGGGWGGRRSRDHGAGLRRAWSAGRGQQGVAPSPPRGEAWKLVPRSALKGPW